MIAKTHTEVINNLSDFVLVPKDIWNDIIHEEFSAEEKVVLQSRIKNMNKANSWKELKQSFLNS